MAKYSSEYPTRPQHVPSPPAPTAADAHEGMARARETARSFLLDGVLLWAAVAFSPASEVTPWVKVQCARLIAEVAGVIPAPVPEPPRPREADGDGGDHSAS